MRLWEGALLVANILASPVLVSTRLRETAWSWVPGLACILVAAVQLTLEGERWQMYPAYAFAGLILVICLIARLRRAPVAFASGPFSAVWVISVLLVAALSTVMPLASPVFQFPNPGGPYPIGTLTYHWVDPSRPDFGDPNQRRELMVQVWYPAQKVDAASYDTYVQSDVNLTQVSGDLRLPGFVLSHLGRVTTHAMRSAPVAETGRRFPVLIFSPGAQGFRQHNTFQVEDLVSHGYIVAAIDHPRAASQVAFPDGRHIDFDPDLIDIPRFFRDHAFGQAIYNYLAGDARFVLDQLVSIDASDPNHILTDRIDTDRAGMFGVSLGGLVTSEACRADRRLRACIVEDVFVPDDAVSFGARQPTMWLTRDADSMRAEGWPDWEVDLHQATTLAALGSARADGYIVRIPGMFHLNYTDFPYTVAWPVTRALGLVGPIDWRRGHRIVNAYTLAFFDRYLKNDSEPLLSGPAAPFPEVTVEQRPATPAAPMSPTNER